MLLLRLRHAAGGVVLVSGAAATAFICLLSAHPLVPKLAAALLLQQSTLQVHNPEYLNNTGIASMVQQHGIRLLAISPHVGNYARQVLEEQGVQVRELLARGGCCSCMRFSCTFAARLSTP